MTTNHVWQWLLLLWPVMAHAFSHAPHFHVSSSDVRSHSVASVRKPTRWDKACIGMGRDLDLSSCGACHHVQDEEGWTAAWKRRYWAPWCVARTGPVKGLMSLYQDFASYKLKEECTWPQVR